MMKSLFSVLVFSFLFVFANANYTTPGTGVHYSLSDLVANSGGDVTFTDAYHVNDTITISLNDTLSITSDVTVKFAAGTFFEVFGTIIIDPPTNVLFTARNTTTGYLGMRINANSRSVLRKLTFEYAVSLRLTDCSPIIDSCTFQYNNNNASTSFGNGAIALFRSKSVISNSSFLYNQRAAIQGGSNTPNPITVINCLFMGNNTTNQNVPQINLGGSGPDTVKIFNNQFLRASTNSGAIGFLPTISLHALITGNTIKNNRYGITLNGGSAINAVISYNVIDSNNTAGNPISGGSGIAFSGGTSSSHQNTIVTGNYIRGNLWGITISPTSTGGGAKPNLGDLTNTDTTDDGKNHIYGNTNAMTPNIEFYNNNVDDIMAQNNYWGSNDPVSVEAAIFHENDDATLGLVNYSNYLILPVELLMFNASLFNNMVTLNWRTGAEKNSDHFIIEKSLDGRSFEPIGKRNAAGNSAAGTEYSFHDRNVASKQYYRLKLVDTDDRFKYSGVVIVSQGEKKELVKLYPTVFASSQPLTAEIISNRSQTISVQFIGSDGRLLQTVFKSLVAGTNLFQVMPSDLLPAGVIQVKFTGGDIDKTIRLVKQ